MESACINYSGKKEKQTFFLFCQNWMLIVESITRVYSYAAQALPKLTRQAASTNCIQEKRQLFFIIHSSGYGHLIYILRILPFVRIRSPLHSPANIYDNFCSSWSRAACRSRAGSWSRADSWGKSFTLFHFLAASFITSKGYSKLLLRDNNLNKKS